MSRCFAQFDVDDVLGIRCIALRPTLEYTFVVSCCHTAGSYHYFGNELSRTAVGGVWIIHMLSAFNQHSYASNSPSRHELAYSLRPSRVGIFTVSYLAERNADDSFMIRPVRDAWHSLANNGCSSVEHRIAALSGALGGAKPFGTRALGIAQFYEDMSQTTQGRTEQDTRLLQPSHVPNMRWSGEVVTQPLIPSVPKDGTGPRPK